MYAITKLSRSRFLILGHEKRAFQLLVIPVKRPTANYQLILTSSSKIATGSDIFQEFDPEIYSTFVYADADSLDALLEVFFEIIQDMDLSNPIELCQIFGGIVHSEFRGKVNYRNTH
jgi:hypothetical protein